MSDRLRIVTIGSPVLGGSGIVARRLAAALAVRGHDSVFLSYAEPEERAPGVRYLEATPEPHPLFPTPLYETAIAERLARLLQEECVDVVHAHYAVGFGQAVVTALANTPRARRPRFILTCHGTDVVGSVGTHALAGVFAAADEVTAVSHDLARRIRMLSPSTAPRVIPNFVDLDLYHPRAKQKRGLTVLHFSNFRPIKQPDLVVDVVRALGREARLVLAGEGPEYARICERARTELGPARMEARGVLHGEDMAACIRQASVVLIPSLYESFSLAALEAHASGVPVVGTTTGGMGEVVIHNETGVLLDPYAPTKAFAQAVRDACAIRNVRRRARAQAERFTLAAALSAYEALYHSERNVSISYKTGLYIPLCG